MLEVIITAIVLMPLIAALIAGLGGRFIGPRGAELITSATMGLAACFAVITFVEVAVNGHTHVILLSRWIVSATFDVAWALRIDTLSAVMLLVVTIVSAAVHIYSIGYMAHDQGRQRFMAYLSLFSFFMLALVTANNFVQMYFGWEGVGLASYLLIGFWYDKPSANAAAIKAFVVNRIGDFGFALGVMGVFFVFDSVDFNTVFAAAPEKAHLLIPFLGHDWPALTVLCILLFIGAMGKSAQLGLHVWLPDAMEGPTPVSALIHAATMVTAGIFMVCRLSPLFELSDTAREVVTIVGATTALFAATVALVQTDIKRVIAYSTCSQLGYMFFAAGVSAYGAAMFHLMTHAAFKALLFLGAGSIIHALNGEQDMRKMGGVWRLVPVTYVLMWIGSLALAGIWPFAGHYSKDSIIGAAYMAGTGVGHYAFWIGNIVAFLTAFYSWRLLFMTFHGPRRSDPQTIEHAHESPMIMLAPLFLLAAGALILGKLGFRDFVGEMRTAFWGNSITVLPAHDALSQLEHIPLWAEQLPLLLALAGIALAYLFYIARPQLPGRLARALPALYQFLLNKWYFDEAYQVLFVRPAFWIGRVFWQGGDRAIIDGVGPDGVALVTRLLSRRTAALQSGYVYHYAFAMLIGIVSFITWYVARPHR